MNESRTVGVRRWAVDALIRTGHYPDVDVLVSAARELEAYVNGEDSKEKQ